MYFKDDENNDLEGYSEVNDEDYYEDSLKKKNIYEYCQYLTFKIVHYIDAFAGSKITDMTTEFAFDNSNQFYLVNAYKIYYLEAQPNDYVLEKVDLVNQNIRDQIKRDLYQNKGKMRAEIISVIKEYMDKFYKNVKKKSRIIEVEHKEIYSDDSNTDKAFKEINPEAPFNFSDLLTNKIEISRFKKWLNKRAQTINGNSNSSYIRTLQKIEKDEKKTNIKQLTLGLLSPQISTKSFFSYDRTAYF